MEKEIQELKRMNAAYLAALEFDYCPDSQKSKQIVDLFVTGISEKELKTALNRYQGYRPNEMALLMSKLIKKL
jgi:hypothetical protein